MDKPRQTISNPHGAPPLRMINRQCDRAGKRPMWLRHYVRWRSLPLGTSTFGMRDLYRLVVGSNESGREGFFKRWIDPLLEVRHYACCGAKALTPELWCSGGTPGPGLLSYQSAGYGVDRSGMEIHINDLTERQLKRLLDEEVSASSEVKSFIDTYVEYYGLYAEGELQVTAKDRSLSKRLCTEYPLPRLKAMLKDFFGMRQGRSDEGLRPDYRLVTFYNMRTTLVENERERRRADAIRKQMHKDAREYDAALERAKQRNREREERGEPRPVSSWERTKRRKFGGGSLADRRARRLGKA